MDKKYTGQAHFEHVIARGGCDVLIACPEAIPPLDEGDCFGRKTVALAKTHPGSFLGKEERRAMD